MTRRRLAVTCGDPAGVGPEIISRWLRETPQRPPVTVFGPKAWLATLADVEGVPVGPDDFALEPGTPSVAGASLAWEAMRRAAAACAEGTCGGVVTAPVSKHWLQLAGYPHPGQTEFFAAAWGGEPTMGFVGERLRVVLATWHHPLAEVPGLLVGDPELLRRAVRRTQALLVALGEGDGRIGVCGLNPHAGEAGMLGHEERDVLDPILDELRKECPGLSPCLPGDTVFWRALKGDFAAVVALYHDQGLAPLKTLEFETAVNVTLGLPFVRTSPDHGTAFGLAGTGQAGIGSFAHAVTVAERLARGGSV